MTHEFSNWCSDDDRCDVTVPHPSGVPVPCARPVDHPVHTAAAPTEQATQPAETTAETDSRIAWELYRSEQKRANDLERVVQRVADLHCYEPVGPYLYCMACTDDDSAFGGVIWPCETMRAISGEESR